MIKVLIYNENLSEKKKEATKKYYPRGIHGAIKEAIEGEDVICECVTLETVETLTPEKLAETDVIIWWGHSGNTLVPDEIAENVKNAVQMGMGAIFLHSAHFSKPFMKLMGSPCNLTWREDGDYELVWVCNPAHPIAQGIGRFIKIDHEETYGEPFGIPHPDEMVFIGSYEGGEVFRSGCCWQRGMGKIFYFQPGHETYPVFYQKEIIQVLRNAVRWAAPICRTNSLGAPKVKKPLEEE